ncbi:hypothetical protein [Mesoterricola silvestris]|uniref:Uncharacterized protein n=1 Tax=Mesoterricola silvestris TaxID=2927979 RepID=A0AA48KA72_9BACT|nr:hypothetical protein [Mesoterricola silvestris]BDU74316.1 hypothetical protein METEAL_34900 [Mesoterricola silvestris]
MNPSPTNLPNEAAVVRRVRGSSFPMSVAAARAAAGEDTWRSLLADLSPRARALAEAPPPFDTWIDADLVTECWLAFRRAGNLGPVPGALGAETIRVRHPGAFQGPEELVAALPGFWRGSVEGGVITAELTGPQSAVVRIWAAWPVPWFFQRHVPAWFTHGLQIAGAHGAAVRHIPPAEPGGTLHEYHLLWS